MKKIVFTTLFLALLSTAFSQEADGKKVQAGLIFGSGMNFQNMKTKQIKADGLGADLSVGAVVNIGFNNNVGFSTGLEFDFDNSNYTFADTTLYAYKDSKILRQSEKGDASGIFDVKSRKQRGIYLTVPTMLIFRTNYIGYFRYFGKFGLRNSFLIGSKVNDEGSNFDLTTLAYTANAKNENMKLNSGTDMLFYRGSVGLAAGAEWNFVGSTCLALEIGYYYGVTPLYYNTKSDKRTLYKANSEYINNAASQSQLLFKLSVLF